MTKHELLTEFKYSSHLTISDLMKLDTVSRVALWKVVESLRRAGCVRIGAMNGREKVYEITVRGLSRLKYYDDRGCSNPLCSEYAKKG